LTMHPTPCPTAARSMATGTRTRTQVRVAAGVVRARVWAVGSGAFCASVCAGWGIAYFVIVTGMWDYYQGEWEVAGEAVGRL